MAKLAVLTDTVILELNIIEFAQMVNLGKCWVTFGISTSPIKRLSKSRIKDILMGTSVRQLIFNRRINEMDYIWRDFEIPYETTPFLTEVVKSQSMYLRGRNLIVS